MSSPADRAHHTLRVIEQRHKPEIHMQLLVAVEKAQTGVVGDEIYFDRLVSSHHHHVLENPGCPLPGDVRQLEQVPV